MNTSEWVKEETEEGFSDDATTRTQITMTSSMTSSQVLMHPADSSASPAGDDTSMSRGDDVMSVESPLDAVVVISDDETEHASSSGDYTETRKRLRRDVDGSEEVVMVTDEERPGPSNTDLPRPPNPIPVEEEDDEPIITNVIAPNVEDTMDGPVTWQLVRSTGATPSVEPAVRRNGYSMSRYRARRPTARRAIRSREYGDFMNFVRDLTSEGVIISPLSRSPERASLSSRRSRAYSRHNVASEGEVMPMSGSRIYPPRVSHRAAAAAGAGENFRTTAASLSQLRSTAEVAREELMHMSNLRDRITTLRRDLQNLNGLLTDSFQLLHRIAPSPSLPRIDKAVLDRAPTRLVSQADCANPDKSCSICLAPYKAGETLRVLPCEHEYHEACIDRWLINCSRKCPFCRTDIQEALS